MSVRLLSHEVNSNPAGVLGLSYHKEVKKTCEKQKIYRILINRLEMKEQRKEIVFL